MFGKTARSRRCNKKVEWSSVNFEDVSYLQIIARIRWRSMDFKWKILPGAKALDTLHKIQADLQGSMFNDIELETKDNEDSCALASRKIKEYASKYNDGHWAFLGPGEESKWYSGYAAGYGGKWDLRASQMVEHIENSGHPVVQGVSQLGRGILKKNIIETPSASVGNMALLTCCTGLFISRTRSESTGQS